MNRVFRLSVVLVCLLAGSALAKPGKTGKLARPADPYEWEFPALVNGKSESRTIRSFLKPQTKNVIVILETDTCDMCDRAAASNRALAKTVRQSDGVLLYLVFGPPADLKSLLERRVYDGPVLFDLDGAFTRTLSADPAEAPLYVVLDEKENVLSKLSGLKVNPATIQLSILGALMVKKTQKLVNDSKSAGPKPATP